MKALLCLFALFASTGTAIGIEVFPTTLESFDYPLLGIQAQITGDVVEGRPRTKVTYVFPGRVTVVGEAPHYQPGGGGKLIGGLP